ncbi:hypothetical protein ACWEKM_41290 [Streptomyces sp. NPDC004752]
MMLPVGVPGDMDDAGAAVGVGDVAVGQGGGRAGVRRVALRQQLRGLGVRWRFTVLEERVRGRAPDHRRVEMVCRHLGAAQLGELARPARLVLMEVVSTIRRTDDGARPSAPGASAIVRPEPSVPASTSVAVPPSDQRYAGRRGSATGGGGEAVR